MGECTACNGAGVVACCVCDKCGNATEMVPCPECSKDTSSAEVVLRQVADMHTDDFRARLRHHLSSLGKRSDVAALDCAITEGTRMLLKESGHAR